MAELAKSTQCLKQMRKCQGGELGEVSLQTEATSTRPNIYKNEPVIKQDNTPKI